MLRGGRPCAGGSSSGKWGTSQCASGPCVWLEPGLKLKQHLEIAETQGSGDTPYSQPWSFYTPILFANSGLLDT